MATIHDLGIADIAKMSDEELKNHILAIRSRRRNPDPEMKAHAKAKAIKKKNNTAALKSTYELLKGVTPEQAAIILKQLQGGKND